MEKKKKGTLIKAFLSKRQINENTRYDSVLIFYRDENGKKQTQFFDRAKIPFFILKNKESEEASSPPIFIEKEKVEKFTTYSDNLYREIALRTGTMPFFDKISFSYGSESSNMKNLFQHNYVYDADMDISDRYIKYFYEDFEKDIKYKLHKCYFDIEVDLMPNGFMKDANGKIGYMGFPDEEEAPCPVNAITLIDEKTMFIHTFILRNPLNTSEIEFEKNVEKFKEELKEKIKNEDDCIINNIFLNFFDSEEEVIESFFNKAHELDPDFLNGWNICFDCITLMNRLKKLYSRKKELREKGIFPRDEMKKNICDKKYFYHKNSLNEDISLTPYAYYRANKDVPYVDRVDTFTILDGINWMDSMLFYANIRKTSGKKESYSLDAIANEELGKEKLPLKPGQTMKNLAWKNFAQFIEYNIRDVLLLHLLERKNLDFDMLQCLSEITNTRKEKIFKKTVSLKNIVNKYAEENGFIMSDNKNAKYGTEEERYYFINNFLNPKKIKEADEKYLELFKKKENYGAFVGDPNLNLPEGIEINGHQSKYIFENVFDQDFSALYPSIIRALNLDPSTLLGKFFWIDKEIKDKLIENFQYDGLFSSSKNEESEKVGETDDLGPTFTDSLLSRNWSKIGEKFFLLPSAEELIKKIKGKN